jgi:hypothetical protein
VTPEEKLEIIGRKIQHALSYLNNLHRYVQRIGGVHFAKHELYDAKIIINEPTKGIDYDRSSRGAQRPATGRPVEGEESF